MSEMYSAPQLEPIDRYHELIDSDHERPTGTVNVYKRSGQIESRLQSLVRLIREGKYSTPKLAAALKVSEPTISRSLAALRERGYSIRSVRDGGEWSYELASGPDTPNDKKGGAP